MEMNLTHEIKEIYDVKTPRHIEFGDPLYYEEYHGKELAGLVIDYKPPQFFQTRLVLRERQYEEFDGAKFLAMVIYFGPPELMHVYLQDKYFKSQTIEEKEIGLDTGRYNLVIDGIGKAGGPKTQSGRPQAKFAQGRNEKGGAGCRRTG